MDGYKNANVLDETALKSVVHFMRYRQFCNYAWDYPDVNPDEKHNLLTGFAAKGIFINEGMFLSR